jgi:WD40 repeat protein
MREGIFCLNKFNSHYIVTGNLSAMNVWDINTGELIRSLQGHAGEIGCVTNYEHFAASGSEDCSVRVRFNLRQVWDVITGESKHWFTGHEGPICAIQMDNNMVVSGVVS